MSRTCFFPLLSPNGMYAASVSAVVMFCGQTWSKLSSPDYNLPHLAVVTELSAAIKQQAIGTVMLYLILLNRDSRAHGIHRSIKLWREECV